MLQHRCVPLRWRARVTRSSILAALTTASLGFVSCSDATPTTSPRLLPHHAAATVAVAVTGRDFTFSPYNSQGSTAGGLAGVNDLGHAAGSEYGVLSAGQGYTDYLWTTASDATPVIACCGIAGAINNSDEVVGWGGPFPQTIAWVWTQGGGTAYPPLLDGGGAAFGVNDGGVVVGVSTSSDFDHGRALVWTPTSPGATTFTAIELPALSGDQYTAARAINNAGQIVGQSSNSAGEMHAVLWQPTTSGSTTYAAIALGTLGGASSRSWAMNALGQVVGQSATSSGVQDAFLWTPDPTGSGGHMLDLGAGVAGGISDNGIVVGNNASGYDAWVWTQATGLTRLPSLNDGSVVLAQGINHQGTSIAGAYKYLNYGTQYPAAWSRTVAAPACVAAPAGMVGWWRGEGDAADALGANPGTMNGGVSFVPGVVGKAFGFDGQTGDVLIGTAQALDVGAGDGLTLEAWVNAQGYTNGDPGPGPIFEYFDGLHLWQYDDPPYAPYTRIIANFKPWWIRANTETPGAFLNSWHHLAFTYSMLTGDATLYIDGQAVSTGVGPSRLSDPSFTGNTASELHIGRRMPGSYGSTGRTYNGYIDEPAIYNRVLTNAEIQGIVAAGSAGKCVPAAVNHAPTANPGGPYPVAGTSALEGSAIAFDGTQSTDPDHDALTYSWNFGDTGVAGGGTATGAMPTHTYADNGRYTVTLTVTDANGAASAPVTTTVVVTNINPTGFLGTDASVVEGSAIHVSMTHVIDATGDLPTLHYAFDCGDGTGYGSATNYRSAGTAWSTLCPTADGPATRIVRAMIFDKDGGSTEYVSNPAVNVTNASPVPTLTTPALTIKTSQSFTVQGSFTDAGTIDASWKWIIDWGDGTAPTPGTSSIQGMNVLSANHSYRSEGAFLIRLTVVDKDGAQGTSSIAVTASGGTNLTWTMASTAPTTTFFGLWGNSAKDVYAVGADFAATTTTPAVAHFDGATWSPMSLPSAYAGAQLKAVSGNSPKNIYVVAQRELTNARIVRYNGSTWSDATPTRFYALNAVWVSATGTVYAAGFGAPLTDGGSSTPLLVHFDGKSWQTISLPAAWGPVSGVWGTSDTDVYIALASSAVAHWNGSAWSISYNPGSQSYQFQALWGSSSNDVFAAGVSAVGGPRLYHDAAGVWSSVSLPVTSTSLFGIWGSSSTDVYAVGVVNGPSTAGILHYNGTTWSPMTVPAGAGRLNAVWGSGPNNVFAVGYGGTLLRGTP